MQDALEFGKLAGKEAEIGFLLVAKPTWKPAPKTLGIAWCRRTWCNHIVLDFLAAHPSTLGKDYAGIGTALLYSIARVAGRIKAPLVWGEATALSAPFYRRVLDVEGILDHFFISEDTLEKMRQRLSLRTKSSKS